MPADSHYSKSNYIDIQERPQPWNSPTKSLITWHKPALCRKQKKKTMDPILQGRQETIFTESNHLKVYQFLLIYFIRFLQPVYII